MSWFLSTRVGRAVLGAGVLLAIVAGLWLGHVRQVAQAYDRGRTDEQARAAALATVRDSAAIAAKVASDAARATLDSSLATTRIALARAQVALQSAKRAQGHPAPALPSVLTPTGRSGPVLEPVEALALDTGAVQQALQACTALANDCDTFKRKALDERVASEARYLGLSTQYNARGDTIQRWRGRVTKKQAAGVGVLSALLGWCVSGGCR